MHPANVAGCFCETLVPSSLKTEMESAEELCTLPLGLIVVILKCAWSRRSLNRDDERFSVFRVQSEAYVTCTLLTSSAASLELPPLRLQCLPLSLTLVECHVQTFRSCCLPETFVRIELMDELGDVLERTFTELTVVVRLTNGIPCTCSPCSFACLGDMAEGEVRLDDPVGQRSKIDCLGLEASYLLTEVRCIIHCHSSRVVGFIGTIP